MGGEKKKGRARTAGDQYITEKPILYLYLLSLHSSRVVL
jgi:hypothetical protein